MSKQLTYSDTLGKTDTSRVDFPWSHLRYDFSTTRQSQEHTILLHPSIVSSMTAATELRHLLRQYAVVFKSLSNVRPFLQDFVRLTPYMAKTQHRLKMKVISNWHALTCCDIELTGSFRWHLQSDTMTCFNHHFPLTTSAACRRAETVSQRPFKRGKWLAYSELKCTRQSFTSSANNTDTLPLICVNSVSGYKWLSFRSPFQLDKCFWKQVRLLP